MSESHPVPLERPSSAVLREPRPPSPSNDPAHVDEREALELHEIQTREDHELDYSSASASSGDEYRVTTRRTTSRATTVRSRANQTGPWSRLCRFWTHHVTLTVPQKSNRDHYGKSIFNCQIWRSVESDKEKLTRSLEQHWKEHSSLTSARRSSSRCKG